MKETKEEYVNFDKESTVQETGPHDAFPARRMNPTERVVESVPIESCIAEYELIKIKKSNCTLKQRKYITERVEKHFANQK